jgi:SHS2 domain-containing protein
MFDLIGRMEESAALTHHAITLQAGDTESLLVGWLEELLFILETDDLMPKEFALNIPGETQLLATVGFVPVRERWKEIKAVTYHELDIHETDAGFNVTIVFDV